MSENKSLFRPSALGRYLVISFVIIWFSMLILIPFIGVIKELLKSNWQQILTFIISPAALHALWLTFVVTISAVIFNTFFGLIMAVVLARQNFRGKLILESLLDLPFAVSPVIVGLMLILLFGPLGWFGKIFESINMKVIYALPGMIIATLFVTFPFVVKEIVPILRQFGVEQEEVSYVLGANTFQTFAKVTLPTIKWGLGYGLTLTIARSIGEFGAVMVVSGSILNKTQTVTLLIHDQFTDFNYEGAFAASIILIIISILIISVTQVFNERKARSI